MTTLDPRALFPASYDQMVAKAPAPAVVAAEQAHEARLRQSFPGSPGMFKVAAPAPAPPPGAPAAPRPAPAPAPAPAAAAPSTREAQLRRMFANSPGMFPPVEPPPPADQVAPASETTPQTPTADPQFAAGLKAVATELGLDEGKAGKVLELHTRVAAEQDKAWDAQVSTWQEATRTDHEIGGQAFTSSISDAQRLVNEFGATALGATLKDGFWSHPEVVRLLARAGKALRVARGRQP